MIVKWEMRICHCKIGRKRRYTEEGGRVISLEGLELKASKCGVCECASNCAIHDFYSPYK